MIVLCEQTHLIRVLHHGCKSVGQLIQGCYVVPWVGVEPTNFEFQDRTLSNEPRHPANIAGFWPTFLPFYFFKFHVIFKSWTCLFLWLYAASCYFIHQKYLTCKFLWLILSRHPSISMCETETFFLYLIHLSLN